MLPLRPAGGSTEPPPGGGHPRPGRPSALARGLPPWVVRRRGPGPWVHLTFDDGPHPAYTPAVLDRLAAYRVAATFFLVGERVVAHPALARRVADAGHAVGYHSFTHALLPALAARGPLPPPAGPRPEGAR